MANWATNRLEFDSEQDAKKVWEGMQIDVPDKTEKRFSFEAVVPSPKTKEECPPEYLIKENSELKVEEHRPWFDWYAWNTAFWGIKWDASEAFFDEKLIYFDTPWGQPLDSVFQKIADKFAVSFKLAVDNEIGGWNEKDYYFSPGKEMVTKPSEWQKKANKERSNWEE